MRRRPPCYGWSSGPQEIALIDFIWQFGEWRLARKDEHIAEILIRESTGEKIPIDRLEVDEARTTLGVDQ